MKTEEDEAFEDIERRQGGGFPAKRAMAADKMQEPVSFPCCGYTDATAIKWNQFNGVVQCHMCGQVYTAAAKPAHCQCTACKDGIIHASDCAVHNGPAYPAGECDCGVAQKTEREALKLALEVMQINLTLLEKIDPYKGQEDLLSDSLELTHEAIASLEAALAQPAQEPVAWGVFEDNNLHDMLFTQEEAQELARYKGSHAEVRPLYTTPPKREWVGLTDEDRKAALLTAYKEWECEEFLLCAREDYLLIEQALMEKNT